MAKSKVDWDGYATTKTKTRKGVLPSGASYTSKRGIDAEFGSGTSTHSVAIAGRRKITQSGSTHDSNTGHMAKSRSVERVGKTPGGRDYEFHSFNIGSNKKQRGSMMRNTQVEIREPGGSLKGYGKKRNSNNPSIKQNSYASYKESGYNGGIAKKPVNKPLPKFTKPYVKK